MKLVLIQTKVLKKFRAFRSDVGSGSRRAEDQAVGEVSDQRAPNYYYSSSADPTIQRTQKPRLFDLGLRESLSNLHRLSLHRHRRSFLLPLQHHRHRFPPLFPVPVNSVYPASRSPSDQMELDPGPPRQDLPLLLLRHREVDRGVGDEVSDGGA